MSRIRESIGRVGPIVAVYRTVDGRWHRIDRTARTLRRRAFDRRRIQRYLRTEPITKLQLGAGPNPLPGWLNTDLNPDIYPEHRDGIVLLDASGQFPMADRTVDYIFSEHMIEHIPELAARGMIRECFRVLRPNGRIRIATPDFTAIVGLQNEPMNELAQHYVDWVMERFWPEARIGNPRCYVINKIFGAHGHRFIYDEQTLSALLSDAGFVDVTRFSPGESRNPILRGLEAHGRALGDENVNCFETMVLEAARPTVPAALAASVNLRQR